MGIIETRNFYLGATVALFTLLTVFYSAPLQAAAAGKVTALEGTVEVARSGMETRALVPGDAVNVGDMLQARERSKCEITFIDGNVLRLAERTRLRITEYTIVGDRRNQKINLFDGMVRSIVQKGKHMLGTEQGGYHEVHTPTAVLGLRGSDMITYFLNGISGGAMNRGSGYGYPIGNAQLVRNFIAGQGLTILGPTQAPIVQPLSGQQLNRYNQETNPGETGEGQTGGTGGASPGKDAGPYGSSSAGGGGGGGVTPSPSQ